MLSASECLLKAENYILAASMAEGRERWLLFGAAAYWRNKAFDLQMERFHKLRDIAEDGRSAEEIRPGRR